MRHTATDRRPTAKLRFASPCAARWSDSGDDHTAVDLLAKARDAAPEWIRYHPMAATVVLEQLERPRKPSDQLAALAAHLRIV